MFYTFIGSGYVSELYDYIINNKIIIIFQAISKGAVELIAKELRNATKCPRFVREEEEGDSDDAEIGQLCQCFIFDL